MRLPYILYIGFIKRFGFKVEFNKNGITFHLFKFYVDYQYKNKNAIGYYIFGKEFN